MAGYTHTFEISCIVEHSEREDASDVTTRHIIEALKEEIKGLERLERGESHWAVFTGTIKE